MAPYPLRSLRSLFLGLVLAGVVACSGRPPEDPVIATFAGGEVRRSDLETWHSFLRSTADNDRRRYEYDALERHVIMRTLAAAALEAGLDEEPSVRLRIREAVDARLAQLLREDVLATVEVPAEEISAYIEAHRDELDKPERRVASLVYRRTAADDAGRTRRIMEEARRRILAGEDFGAVARELSESTTRFQEGRLGTVRPGQLPEALDRTLFSLAEGEVSPLIESDSAFAILRADRVLPAYTMDAAEARDRVESFLRRGRFQKAWADLETELGAVEIHHDLAALRDPDTPLDAVVSRFGDQTLKRGEALDLLDREADGAVNGGDDGARLDSFAHHALLAAEARRRGLDERPDLAAQLHWLRIEELSQAELFRRVGERLSVPTEEDLRRTYAQNGALYREPDRFRLRLYRVVTPTGEDAAAAYRSLTDVVDDVRGGAATFAEATGQMEPASWFSRPQLVGWGADVVRSVDELAPGQITDPIQVGEELWVLQLVERERGAPLPFDAARDQVRRRWSRSERQRLVQEILQWTLAGAALERLPAAQREEAGEGVVPSPAS